MIMRPQASSLTTHVSQRWLLSFPFVLALLVLVFLGWTAYIALIFPDDGIIDLLPNGSISEIDPLGPSFKYLQKGDLIISVDGVPAQIALLASYRR